MGRIHPTCPFTIQVLAAADCVVITTNHASYDWNHIRQTTTLLVDTRNALTRLPDESLKSASVVRLGTNVEDMY